MVHWSYTFSLLETCAYLYRNGVEVICQPHPGDSLVPRARNVLVAKFMGTDCTHILFADADQKWQPEPILRMIHASMKHEEMAVICGAVPRKRLPISFVANLKGAVGDKITMHDPTGYIELHDAGTGLLMIRRDALVRLMDAYPQRKCYFRDERDEISEFEYLLFDCFVDRDLRYLSEDYGFSRLWQSIGGRVWLDPDMQISHFGMQEFSGNILESLLGDVETKKGETVCQR